MVAIERPHQPQRTAGYGYTGPQVQILSIETVDDEREASRRAARRIAVLLTFLALFGVAIFFLVNA